MGIASLMLTADWPTSLILSHLRTTAQASTIQKTPAAGKAFRR
jgi:hypothetical protein